MKKKDLLGQILLKEGTITQEQLEEALEEQKRWEGKIGQHLVRIGAISPEKLIDSISYQLSVARIDFSRSPITMAALELVPKKTCERYNLIPVARKNQGNQKRLLVAMSDPLDYDAIREVEFLSGCVVTSVLALESDIKRAVDFCYSADGLRECPTGLPSATGIELEEFEDNGEQAIIFTQDGRELMVGMESRTHDIAIRALVDLLVKKGMFTVEEFHEQLELCKGQCDK